MRAAAATAERGIGPTAAAVACPTGRICRVRHLRGDIDRRRARIFGAVAAIGRRITAGGAMADQQQGKQGWREAQHAGASYAAAWPPGQRSRSHGVARRRRCIMRTLEGSNKDPGC